MLIEFKSENSADILMFGDSAKALIQMMGHSGAVPGSIAAADLAAALNALHGALTAQEANYQASHIAVHHHNLHHDPLKSAAPDDDEDPAAADVVPLSRRAQPLIHMLEKAIEHKDFVVWDIGE